MIISATVLSPCKDCTDRCIGCHSTCGDYAIYKQKLEENRAKQNAMNAEYEFRKQTKAVITREARRKERK